MTIPSEPLFFTPHYKEKIWGGRRLATLFDKHIPEGLTIGESWELSVVDGSVSTIDRGSLSGQSLGTLFNATPEMLVGKSAKQLPAFPLLIKFIDASGRLSVQVHPDELRAREVFGDQFGKTECWYIAQAGASGALALGLKKDVSKKDLRLAAENGTIEEILNCIKVKTGDVYFVPAGTVHAILDDVVIYEVQQNSDTTLRLYDWTRTDATGLARPLQIEQAVDAADRRSRESYRIESLRLSGGEYSHYLRVVCSYFALEEFIAEKKVTIDLEQRRSCRIVTFLDGDARLGWNDGRCTIHKGETVLFPAVMGTVSVALSSGGRFLMTTVPDIQDEIIRPLEAARYSSTRIAQLMGNRVEKSSGDR